MSIGPKGMKTRVTATRYPVTEGLTAETTKTAGKVTTLIAEEGSNVARRYKVGIED